MTYNKVRNLNALHRARLIEMVHQGLPYATIGREFALSVGSVAYQAQRVGLRRREPYRQLTLSEVEEFRRRLARGENHLKLATEYGVSRITAWRIKKNKIDIRRKVQAEHNVKHILRAMRRKPWLSSHALAEFARVKVEEVQRVKSLLRARDSVRSLKEAKNPTDTYTLVDWLGLEAPARALKLTERVTKDKHRTKIIGSHSKAAVDILLQRYGIA